jgi:hypothetical protein
MRDLIPHEQIERSILLLRGHKVMLSMDLAKLYGVAPRALVQAVKRNRKRFPPDFMFQLNLQEVRNLKSQIVTSSWGGMRRAAPYAFTEQGVAMLSSVLNSERAILVNVAIMRAFVKLRELIGAHKELAGKLTELERRVSSHDGHIKSLFDAIRQLMEPQPSKPRRIGFRART